MQLPPDDKLMLVSGCAPIRAKKARYYEVPELKARVLQPPIDASPDMLARAETKAKRAGADVAFVQATAQALPFADPEFDVVFSTVMLHHLSRRAREECVRKMRRVLRPDGRIVVVNFAPRTQQKGFLHGFHRHGHVKLEDIIANLEAVGLKLTESSPLG